MPKTSGKAKMMSASDAVVVDRYRELYQRAENDRCQVREMRVRIRQQVDRVEELVAVARQKRDRYQQMVAQRGSPQPSGDGAQAAKQEVASAEADLTEAKGTLQRLEAELPKLEAGIPKSNELEQARREAWAAVSRDLQSRVSREANDMASKIYAALRSHNPQAPFTAALTAICPAPPSREQCSKLAEELAKEYDIPMS